MFKHRFANIAKFKQLQREEKKRRLYELKMLEEERKERMEMKMEDYDADPKTIFNVGKTEQSDALSEDESVGGVSMYVYKE